jgi:hypothetical protein
MEFVAELDQMASEAFGPYWEERGRSQLRERALALLALLGGIAIAGGEGSAQAASFLGRPGHHGRRNMVLGGAAVAVILGLAATGTVYALTGNNTPSGNSPAPQAGAGSATGTSTGTASPAAPGSASAKASATTTKKPTASASPSASASATLPATTPATTPSAGTASTAAPKLTVSLSSSPASPDAVTCGGTGPTFTLTGTVTASRATTISYTWKRSNGTSSSGSAQVGANGSVTLHDTLAAASTSWNGSDALDVTSPVTESSSLPLSVSCTYPAISISTSSLPASGDVNDSYAGTLSATGGDGGPYTWTATGLPPGLSLSGDQVTGTPTTAGGYSVTITVKDSHGDTASQASMITISTPIIP